MEPLPSSPERPDDAAGMLPAWWWPTGLALASIAGLAAVGIAVCGIAWGISAPITRLLGFVVVASKLLEYLLHWIARRQARKRFRASLHAFD